MKSNEKSKSIKTLVGVQKSLPLQRGEHHDFSLPSTEMPGEKFSTFVLSTRNRGYDIPPTPSVPGWTFDIRPVSALFGRLWDTPVVPVLPNWRKICDPHGPTPVLSLSDGRQVSSEKQSGYIYFIQDGDNQRIKIGKAKDPEIRLDALQTANSGILTLLVAIPSNDMVEDEKYFHKKFAASHLRGEWFLNSQELMDFIEEEYDR